MENEQNIILAYIKEATGKSDVGLIDYKDIKSTTKEQIDFKKVRGSVRMMSNKVKTASDIEAMKKAFLALRIP